MRKPLLALAALFLALVIAVPAVVAPLFPVTLPANTVWGRLGIGPGPGQAIPFGTLFANLFNGGSAPTAHGILIGEGTAPLNSVVCADAQIPVGQTSADPACKTLSGDVAITDLGAATIQPGVVSNAKLAQGGTNTVKGNIGSGEADLSAAQVGTLIYCPPSRTVLTTGTSQTYTTPTCNGLTATWLEVEVQGGGGGGAGSGTSNNAGSNGNASSFGALNAGGGVNGSGSGSTGGAGGTCSGSLGTQQNFPGTAGAGSATPGAVSAPGGWGGMSFYGGAGAPGPSGAAGGAAPTNSGGGGAGGSGSGTAGVNAVGGGGAGCHISAFITSPSATYTYTVGTTAPGGAAGTSGFVGGIGAAGLITILAHWQ